LRAAFLSPDSLLHPSAQQKIKEEGEGESKAIDQSFTSSDSRYLAMPVTGEYPTVIADDCKGYTYL